MFCSGYIGFSDWYGYPPRQDHLCKGRREAVLGSELIDDYVYQRPPLSRLQAAIMSGGASGED